MKYGQQLESESVPEWSLHNLDYNTLKEFIKVNTTRDQATAIAIPGHRDTALDRFENDFYDELCRQHDRVGLFVATKADELGRRLQHISDQAQRLMLRGTSPRGSSIKRQRRFAKYDRATTQLSDEVRDLSRFVNAQVVAFRKILKKYRKWTGSSSLGVRFRENILSDPKSFTRRDFTHLESQCDELLMNIRAATPHSSSPQTPQNGTITPDESGIGQRRRSSARSQLYSSSSSTLHALSSSAGSLVAQTRASSGDSSRHVTILVAPPIQTHYWNEYDDGSEAGDIGGDSGGYAIYLQPGEESEFPSMAAVVSLLTGPYEKAKKWVAARSGKRYPIAIGENAPLLSANGGYGTSTTADVDENGFPCPQNAHATTNGAVGLNGNADTDNGDDVDGDDDDDDRESGDGDDVFGSDNGFPQGYETHYAAFPSINDQLIAQYRDVMLFRGVIMCYAAAVGLLGIAAILIATGRHKMRAEVDAGVTMGVVSSLGFACAALGMNMARQRHLSMINQIAVWAMFVIVCVLSGVLLVFVMGNTVV